MLQKKQLRQTIAWNGIAFKTPEDWEIESLDDTHMLIGEDGSPKIEIKWTESPKKFTLENYLKRFIDRSQKLLKITIHELPHPFFFSHDIKTFDFFFFSWENESSNGNGVLIFCSCCKKLTMIRFFSGSQISFNSLPALILCSFTDHPKSDQTRWQLFGLNFSTPRSLKLLEYSFKPGSYTIKLKQKKTTLTFFSWGPALFLLSKNSLSKFATQRLPDLKGFATTGVCRHGNYLEWSYRNTRFKNADLIPFLNKYSSFTLFRICHDRQNNRIYGIMVDSSQKFKHDLIKGSILGDI